MPDLRMAELNSCSCRDTIVELVLYGHGVLGAYGVHPVGSVAVREVEIGLGTLAHIDTELWSEVDEEGKAFLLPTPCQVCHERHLYVVYRPAVFLRQSCCRVYYWHVVDIHDVLLPSHLAVVNFSIQRADGAEILLADVSHGQSSGDAVQLGLRHLWGEAYARHVQSAVEADGEVVAMFAYLRRHGHRDDREYCRYYEIPH